VVREGVEGRRWQEWGTGGKRNTGEEEIAEARELQARGRGCGGGGTYGHTPMSYPPCTTLSTAALNWACPVRKPKDAQRSKG
jgi:hypothetical protein